MDSIYTRTVRTRKSYSYCGVLPGALLVTHGQELLERIFSKVVNTLCKTVATSTDWITVT